MSHRTATRHGRFGIQHKAAQLRSGEFRCRLSELYDDLGIGDYDRGKTPHGPDLKRAAASLGLFIDVDRRYPAEGMIGKNSAGERIIGLREEPDAGRARFTLAHEIAHEVVRQQRLKLVGENRERFCIDDVEEEFCDFVAGLLLMPMRRFFRRVSKLAHDFPEISFRSYYALAAEFRVSISALLLQITLLRSFAFMYEVYDYSPVASEADAAPRLSPLARAFTGNWSLPKYREFAANTGATRGIARFIYAVDSVSVAMSHVPARPWRRSVNVDPALRDRSVDWSNGSARIVLERAFGGPRRQVWHILRPVIRSAP